MRDSAVPLELKPGTREAVTRLYAPEAREQIKLLLAFLQDAGLLSGLLEDLATIMVDVGLAELPAEYQDAEDRGGGAEDDE